MHCIFTFCTRDEEVTGLTVSVQQWYLYLSTQAFDILSALMALLEYACLESLQWDDLVQDNQLFDDQPEVTTQSWDKITCEGGEARLLSTLQNIYVSKNNKDTSASSLILSIIIDHSYRTLCHFNSAMSTTLARI